MGNSSTPEWALIIHGGVDPREATQYSAQEHAARHQALAEALGAGQSVLANGGRSVDAVQAAIRVLEDAPEFNAGRGATLTHDGEAELDAAIMEGRDRRAGAVAGLRRVKNPIDLARAVLDHSPHVLLIGAGAEAFGESQNALRDDLEYVRYERGHVREAALVGNGISHAGNAVGRGGDKDGQVVGEECHADRQRDARRIAFVDPEYFRTPRQREALRRALEGERALMSSTVGAVALDRHGNLAAGSSTGGMTNKRYGRVGDTPLIGAGTYADNSVCAITTTGWGEFFIRTSVAHDIWARMKYAGHSLADATQAAVTQVAAMGGYGGVIAIDFRGQLAAPFSTVKMAHGYVVAGSPAVIELKD